MKRLTAIGGLVVGLLLVAVVLLQGQPRAEAVPEAKKEPRKLSTSGVATIRVKPDSARVFFGVQTMAPTIKQAREESSQKVTKVLSALSALQIPDLKMKTSDVTVELLQSTRSDNKLPEILGYRLTNSFTVLIKGNDPQKLGTTAGTILDTALENGANLVQQIVIFRQDSTEAKRQALAKAVEDALANAEAIVSSKALRTKIADTISIDGHPEYSGGRYQYTNRAQAMDNFGGEGETPVLAGDVEITCRVAVTCTY
jgi:uncharacterized protein YggE